jgi:hypothetical protein
MSEKPMSSTRITTILGVTGTGVGELDGAPAHPDTTEVVRVIKRVRR